MATNFNGPIVLLDVPVDHQGLSLTHAAITEVTFDTRPGSEVAWVMATYGRLISDELVLTEGPMSHQNITDPTDLAAIYDTVSNVDETAHDAIFRAAANWMLSEGHLAGSII